MQNKDRELTTKEFAYMTCYSEKVPSYFAEVQTKLMAYLQKVKGHGSRKVGEVMNISHTTASEYIKEGEQFYNQLHWVMKEITDLIMKKVEKAKTEYEKAKNLPEWYLRLFVLKGLFRGDEEAKKILEEFPEPKRLIELGSREM